MPGGDEDRSDGHLEVPERGPEATTTQRGRINGAEMGRSGPNDPGPSVSGGVTRRR
jgi:hypothetical protein